MSLRVFTGPLTYSGFDRFDVTRKSGGPEGVVFAPTWDILMPVIEQRKIHKKLRKKATGEGLFTLDLEEDRVWNRFVEKYLAEMRSSYRTRRNDWNNLLTRGEVTLVCFCSNAGRCHRTILASRILPTLGALNMGEREEKSWTERVNR